MTVLTNVSSVLLRQKRTFSNLWSDGRRHPPHPQPKIFIFKKYGGEGCGMACSQGLESSRDYLTRVSRN